jgi:hypothetical protein
MTSSTDASSTSARRGAGAHPGRGAPTAVYFARSLACTLLIEEVEAIWKPIADRDYWSVFRDKLAAIEEMRQAYAPARRVAQQGFTV